MVVTYCASPVAAAVTFVSYVWANVKVVYCTHLPIVTMRHLFISLDAALLYGVLYSSVTILRKFYSCNLLETSFIQWQIFRQKKHSSLAGCLFSWWIKGTTNGIRKPIFVILLNRRRKVLKVYSKTQKKDHVLRVHLCRLINSVHWLLIRYCLTYYDKAKYDRFEDPMSLPAHV